MSLQRSVNIRLFLYRLSLSSLTFLQCAAFAVHSVCKGVLLLLTLTFGNLSCCYQSLFFDLKPKIDAFSPSFCSSPSILPCTYLQKRVPNITPPCRQPCLYTELFSVRWGNILQGSSCGGGFLCHERSPSLSLAQLSTCEPLRVGCESTGRQLGLNQGSPD